MPKKFSNEVTDLPIEGDTQPGLMSQGFVVPIEVALKVIEQVVDQLNSEKWVNPETGKVIESRFAGLIGCFYDKGDAQYLAKMLRNFIP